MFRKIAGIAIGFGITLSLLMAGKIIYDAQNIETVVDVVILFGSMMLFSEARSYIGGRQGIPTENFPKNGDYVIEGMPATELMDEKSKFFEKEDISLLLQLAPKRRSQRRGEIKTYRLAFRDIVPSDADGHSQKELFELIKTSQPGDIIRFADGKMSFTDRSIYHRT